MATVGIPVLIWEDHHGQYTAATLEWGYRGTHAAYDDTRSGALQQLKRFFEWQVKANDVEPETDFFNPELFHVRVRVRPEYRGSARNRRYPTRAKRQGETGTVVVYFVIEGNGRISGARVDKSSGSSALDKAAVATLKRLKKFKPIPAALGRNRWAVRVPIKFSLK